MEYDIIQAADQTIHIDDGETFENKLIDMRNGRTAMISTWGSTNWTIRNVGFIGKHNKDVNAIVCSDPKGGDSLIENVYMGDGCNRPAQYSSHGQVGIFVHKKHSGHLTIRDVNVQGWPNNGMYANPPYYDGKGTVHIDRCYAANNYVTNFRLGSRGSKITNSVAVNTTGTPFNGRNLWAWGDRVEVDGCRFRRGPYSGASIHIRDSTHVDIRNTTYDTITKGGTKRGTYTHHEGVRVSSAVDVTPPSTVPVSGIEAASGGEVDGSTPAPKPPDAEPAPDPAPAPADGGDHPDLAHSYEFVNTGDAPADYFLEVEEGPIKPSSINGATVDPGMQWVSKSGRRAAGRVPAGDRHAYEFNTNLLDVTVDPAEHVTTLVNGNQSHLSRYPQPGAGGEAWKTGRNFPWLSEGEVSGPTPSEPGVGGEGGFGEGGFGEGGYGGTVDERIAQLEAALAECEQEKTALQVQADEAQAVAENATRELADARSYASWLERLRTVVK